MAQSHQYQVNDKQVVHEAFNDEILVINLDKGNYFSLRGSGAEIWPMILGGATSAAITDALCAAYAADRARVAPEVEQFLRSLVDHELLVPVSAAIDAVAGLGLPVNGTRSAYAPPLLEVFTDMQDLLLLDPVHEADDAGWPVQKQA